MVSLPPVRADGGDRPVAVVVGGANTDVKARSLGPAQPGTSNPGTVTVSPGGVGRNVAETLARLGTATDLVAAVGSDDLGDRLLAATAAAGVGVGAVRRSEGPTGTYTAVLGPDGELVVAVSDMGATDGIGPADVDAARDLMAAADLVVLDGNLAPATLARALDAATDAGTRVVLEPVSVPKAQPRRPPPHPRQAPARRDPGPGRARRPHRPADGLARGSSLTAVAALHARGVTLVWVRLGGAGSLLSGPDGVSEHAAVPTAVVDVTGAGDAMLGAFCHALLAGSGPADAVRWAHAAAAVTVASPHTVRPDLTPALVDGAAGPHDTTPRSPA